MKVVHFKKMFLHNTETFIYNQIINTKNIENYVICRELNIPNSFDFSKITEVKEIAYKFNWSIQKCAFAFLGICGKYYTFDIQKIIDYLKELKPDIFHVHFGPDANYFLPIKRKIGIPMVTSFYGYDVSSFPKEYFGFARRVYQNLAREGEIFIAMTDDMKTQLIELEFPEEKIIVHYFGINSSIFANRERDYSKVKKQINLLQVASLIEKKGHWFLLQAINKLVHEHNRLDVKLNIIGTGPTEAKLRTFVQNRKLDKYVDFLGFVSFSETYLDHFYNSDIYVHHSVTDGRGNKEGIPTTVVEALATGLPVISTYHAGIPDVVKHETSGYLTEERDVTSLTTYLLRLLDDQKLREKLGRNGRKFAIEQCDIKKNSLNLEKIYSRALKS